MVRSARVSLQLRMVVSVLLFVCCVLGFVVGVWAVIFAVLAPSSNVGSALYATAGTTTILLVVVGYVERDQVLGIERRTDATIVSRADRPVLYATVTRVAAQLNVPVPTIALSAHTAPEAMIVGLSPDRMTLVLSQGTLESVTQAELDAVVAHELAHVANRDAMVMTVVSVPAVVADEFRARARGGLERLWSERGRETGIPSRIVATVPLLTLLTVATIVWVAGRTVVAVLSRARELAADRAAVEVTGSPATVASALRTLDDRIDETPRVDLREASCVSTLSILPLESPTVEKLVLRPDSDAEPVSWSMPVPIEHARKRLFGTHPPTGRRIDELAAFERSIA